MTELTVNGGTLTIDGGTIRSKPLIASTFTEVPTEVSDRLSMDGNTNRGFSTMKLAGVNNDDDEENISSAMIDSSGQTLLFWGNGLSSTPSGQVKLDNHDANSFVVASDGTIRLDYAFEEFTSFPESTETTIGSSSSIESIQLQSPNQRIQHTFAARAGTVTVNNARLTIGQGGLLQCSSGLISGAG